MSLFSNLKPEWCSKYTILFSAYLFPYMYVINLFFIFQVSLNNDEKSKKSFTPMTKEQYDEKQSVVRKVFDEDTGRMRLVKG